MGWRQREGREDQEEEEDEGISEQDLAAVQEMDESENILAKLKALKK